MIFVPICLFTTLLIPEVQMRYNCKKEVFTTRFHLICIHLFLLIVRKEHRLIVRVLEIDSSYRHPLWRNTISNMIWRLLKVPILIKYATQTKKDGLIDVQVSKLYQRALFAVFPG